MEVKLGFAAVVVSEVFEYVVEYISDALTNVVVKFVFDDAGVGLDKINGLNVAVTFTEGLAITFTEGMAVTLTEGVAVIFTEGLAATLTEGVVNELYIGAGVVNENTLNIDEVCSVFFFGKVVTGDLLIKSNK